MAMEQPAPIEFGEVHGTHGNILEAVTADRQTVLRMRHKDIRAIGEKVLAQQARSEFAINDSTKLAVYEKRLPSGLHKSGSELLIDLGAARRLALTVHQAHQLACVLLAYAAQEDAGNDWLVRVESSGNPVALDSDINMR